MTAVRRVWCPQDAQDAWLAAHAVHAKGFRFPAGGGVLPDLPPLQPLPATSVRRSRVLCEYMLTAPEVRAIGVGTAWLQRLNEPPAPLIERSRSRRRGRHHITRQNPDPLRVHDFKDGA